MTDLSKLSPSTPVQQAATPQRKLFNYYMRENTEAYNEQRLFFYRTNRWRFNTKDHMRANKMLRLKNPLYFAIGIIIAVDWTYGWHREVGHH